MSTRKNKIETVYLKYFSNGQKVNFYENFYFFLLIYKRRLFTLETGTNLFVLKHLVKKDISLQCDFKGKISC